MAVLVPLNTFKSTTVSVGTSDTLVYQTGFGVSTVVLLAQFVNTEAATGNVSANLVRGSTTTELIKNFEVPGYDAGSFLTGRLVLEEGDILNVKADNANFKFVFSYLETANA